MTSYDVRVTREDGQWLASVPALDTQTYASNLTALDRHVREVIVLSAELPDDAMDGLELVWVYDVDQDAVRQAAGLRAAALRQAIRSNPKRGADEEVRRLIG